jgi:Dolichyl-phosphate-mannose-protein mannosyltransferase
MSDKLSRPVLIGLAVCALALVIGFDFGPPVAFVDDWTFAWSARLLADGHGLHIPPPTTALAIPQIGIGALALLAGADRRVLRLVIVPFLLLTGVCLYRLSRNAGADRTWAAIAALGFCASPLTLAVATSFMTDIPYLGFLAAALLCAAGWVEGRRGRTLCIVLTVLAALQRQQGALIPIAIVAALLIARRRRTVARSDWIALAVLVLASLAAYALPVALGLRKLEQGGAGPSSVLSAIVSQPWLIVLGLLSVPPLVALLSLPLAAAGATSPLPPSRRSWFALASFAPLLALYALQASITHQVFPGDYFDYFGLGPSTPFNLYGPKPAIFGVWIFALVGIACLAWAVRLWVQVCGTWPSVTPTSALLVAAVIVGLAPINKGVVDRYFLPVALPLVPLIAGWVSRQTVRPSWAMSAAVIAAGLVMYAAGEQDYEAWQQARDAAARIAYLNTDPAQVEAGYEADNVYWALPQYERTGSMPSADRPGCKLMLEFSSPSDPRPGVAYQSLAPGRVVIVAGCR